MNVYICWIVRGLFLVIAFLIIVCVCAHLQLYHFKYFGGWQFLWCWHWYIEYQRVLINPLQSRIVVVTYFYSSKGYHPRLTIFNAFDWTFYTNSWSAVMLLMTIENYFCVLDDDFFFSIFVQLRENFEI